MKKDLQDSKSEYQKAIQAYKTIQRLHNKKTRIYLSDLVEEVNSRIKEDTMQVSEDNILLIIGANHEGCMAYQVVLTTKGICYREIDFLDPENKKISDKLYEVGKELQENQNLILKLEEILKQR